MIKKITSIFKSSVRSTIRIKNLPICTTNFNIGFIEEKYTNARLVIKNISKNSIIYAAIYRNPDKSVLSVLSCYTLRTIFNTTDTFEFSIIDEKGNILTVKIGNVKTKKFTTKFYPVETNEWSKVYNSTILAEILQ